MDSNQTGNDSILVLDDTPAGSARRLKCLSSIY